MDNFSLQDPTQPHSFLRLLLTGFMGLVACFPASAVYKCTVDSKIIFQELPCAASLPTVAQELEKKQKHELLHQKLDALWAKGIGIKARSGATPAPTAAPVASDIANQKMQDEEKFRAEPRSRGLREARQAETSRKAQQTAMEQNENVKAQLQKSYDDMVVFCGGKVFKNPVLGMRDEQFRLCTLPNRLGAIAQVVVADDNGIPLRLYFSPMQPETRVYTIDGLVTAIKR
jgi:hypothetical protein